MRFSELLGRGSSEPAAADAQANDAASAAGLPIADYEGLHEKDVIAHFHRLSQVELAEVEVYERAHRNRPVVLQKLRYMRGVEPVAGYDALDPKEIVRLLETSDSAAIRAIRDYEGKFRGRRQVMNAAAQALPNAVLNVDEQNRRDEKAQRTRTGIQDRRDITG
jgi:hypothetical protein